METKGFIEKAYAVFDGQQDPGSLPSLCLALLSEQKETWSDCRLGYESLARARVREIRCRRFSVRVQHNQGRMKSTMADVNTEGINRRRCFLCPANLPEGQKIIGYRGSYRILCNPMPVFSSHYTVCHVEHRSQAISGNIATLLQLSGDFGDPWAILYNGPRCGASAPDHLHFQAVPSDRMPIEREILRDRRIDTVAHFDGVLTHRASDLGREALIIEGSDPRSVAVAFDRLLAAMGEALDSDGEPMMSIIGRFTSGVQGSGGEGRWSLIVFPRAKHRPEAFFREGDARIAISPAVVEMGGILVAPMERDFEYLDAATVESIFNEVSLDRRTVDQVIRTLTTSGQG